MFKVIMFELFLWKFKKWNKRQLNKIKGPKGIENYTDQ